MPPNLGGFFMVDRKSGSAGMPRPRSYAVFCVKKRTPSPCFSFGPIGFPERESQTCASHAYSVVFFPHTATTDIYTLSLHDALPIFSGKTVKLMVLALICLGNNRQD